MILSSGIQMKQRNQKIQKKNSTQHPLIPLNLLFLLNP